MKKITLTVLVLLCLALFQAAHAQTPISCKVGTQKVATVALGPGRFKSYAISLTKGQVLNLKLEGDIGVSKTNDFPVVSILMDYKEGVDRVQDGEAYYSLLAGRSGQYIFRVASGAKEARTFKLKVNVSGKKSDFLGGEPVKDSRP